MSDLIRKSDALAVVQDFKRDFDMPWRDQMTDAIAALPAVTVGDSLWFQFGPMGEVESVSDEPLDGHQEYARILAALEPVAAPDPAAITADEFDKRSRGYMPAKGTAE